MTVRRGLSILSFNVVLALVKRCWPRATGSLKGRSGHAASGRCFAESRHYPSNPRPPFMPRGTPAAGVKNQVVENFINLIAS